MTEPLTGFAVGVTGDRRAEEQIEMLTRRGAQVVHGPVMRTRLLHDAEATRAATEQVLRAPVDVIVLTTGIGTRSWLGVAESAGLAEAIYEVGREANVLARGPKARSAALGHGLEVHWQAPTETSAELLARLAEIGVAGRRVVVQRDGGDDRLARAVAALGADVVDVPVYRWGPPEDEGPALRLIEAACATRLHAVTFTCAYAVERTFLLAPEPSGLRDALNGPVAAVAVGPVCAGALRAHGVARVVEPARARLGAMVQALVADLADRHRLLRAGAHVLRWQGDALVQSDGSVTTMTPGEARLLSELVRRGPAVIAKRELVDEGAGDHAAEAAIARLRAKLGPLGPAIRTVPRRGYACDLELMSA